MEFLVLVVLVGAVVFFVNKYEKNKDRKGGNDNGNGGGSGRDTEVK